MIGLVTDSNSQMPAALAHRYGIEVVPLIVTVDGVDHREGVDLSADEFYSRFDAGTPEVSTSQPSPGAFAQAYQRLAERGATDIVSIHLTETLSGTVNAARLAAIDAPVPVSVIDSGTASFGISCCVWEAAEAIATGSALGTVCEIAESVAARVETVFIIQALDLARKGGRVDLDDPETAGAIPVLTTSGPDLVVLGEVTGIEEANDAMAAHIVRGDADIRVAIGIADTGAAPFWSGLEERVAGHPRVKDVVRYRVGPSVGVHTGPGTAGAFFYPVI